VILEKDNFEAWMERIMNRFDMLENKFIKGEKARHRIDGELLMDNQDVCMMLNISKRTLQRHRSSGNLPFKRIDQKTYYLESDVMKFIREPMNRQSPKRAAGLPFRGNSHRPFKHLPMLTTISTERSAISMKSQRKTLKKNDWQRNWKR
jgi:hypothetical protein